MIIGIAFNNSFWNKVYIASKAYQLVPFFRTFGEKIFGLTGNDNFID